jgi:hypothetical protein
MDTSTSTPGSSPQADGANHRWEGHMSNGLGATYGLNPMAFLSADAGQIVLSGSLGTFAIPRASVVKIGRGGLYPWFFAALRLRHNKAGIPEELQFKPVGVSPAEVRARLKSLGYPVS